MPLSNAARLPFLLMRVCGVKSFFQRGREVKVEGAQSFEFVVRGG